MGELINIRAVLHGPQDLRIEETSVDPPASGEAQVEIKASGLCGSDLHYFIHAKNGPFIHKDPAVLGHEASGIVTAVGSGVLNVRLGDRVAIEAGIQCGECRLCLEGRYNLCPKMRYCSSAKSSPILHGTLQTYINHPSRLLHILPPNVSFEQGALVEPLSVGLHASHRAPISPGQSTLVLGAGAMGILQCAISRASGAACIVVADIDADRVAFATNENFATAGHMIPLLPKPKSNEELMDRSKDLGQQLIDKFQPGTDGFDVVYECTGVESCTQTAIYASRPGGMVCIIGMGSVSANLPLAAAMTREVDIVGVMRFANVYPKAIGMFASGRLKGVEKLVTARYSVKESAKAFETCRKGKDEDGNMVLKVVVGDY